MSRPEHEAPPEFFYDDAEAQKYTTNTRMMEIQRKMSERAIELLMLPQNEGPKLLLDIGCGSGLSGEVLEEAGHHWVGLDISPSMLNVARERELEGDVFLSDMGQGLFFRPGMFDGAISISALQWLCNADKKSHNPRARIAKFFQSLYNSLARGARAVLQFYPENPQQMEMMTASAIKCGFTGGLVVDYPHSTRAKKYFLCLFAGSPMGGYQLPKAKGENGGEESDEEMEEDEEGEEEQSQVKQVGYSNKRVTEKRRRSTKREPVKSKDWIKSKKESQRRKGKEVRDDSKYTGRKRSGFRA